MQISPEDCVGSRKELANCGLQATPGRHLSLCETWPHPLPGHPLAAFTALWSI